MDALNQLASNINALTPEVYQQAIASALYSLHIAQIVTIIALSLGAIFFVLAFVDKPYNPFDSFFTMLSVLCFAVGIILIPLTIIDKYQIEHFPKAYAINYLSHH